MTELVEKLYNTGDLSDSELKALIETNDSETAELLRRYADETRQKSYGKKVFLRGLIEVSSYCRNDCLYCGIRRSNKEADRYRLSREEIMSCCENGYGLGFRTFVMQGGEDSFFTDDFMCSVISEIKEYSKLHPAEMSLAHRKECLFQLRELGYQVGAGFMVGAPYQTTDHIIADLRFLQELRPQMIGIGPFVPHHNTPFAEESGGTLALTLRLLGILRLMFPKVLLPATTALGTITPNGRELGLKTGCNVVMPNLSPVKVRKKYDLYDNKICTGEEAAECRGCLQRRIESAGYEVSAERGDCI